MRIFTESAVDLMLSLSKHEDDTPARDNAARLFYPMRPQSLYACLDR